jgi:hypothetical protein
MAKAATKPATNGAIPEAAIANGKQATRGTKRTLAVGPITIQTLIYVAARSEGISFNMLHDACRNKLKQAGYHGFAQQCRPAQKLSILPKKSFWAGIAAILCIAVVLLWPASDKHLFSFWLVYETPSRFMKSVWGRFGIQRISIDHFPKINKKFTGAEHGDFMVRIPNHSPWIDSLPYREAIGVDNQGEVRQCYGRRIIGWYGKLVWPFNEGDSSRNRYDFGGRIPLIAASETTKFRVALFNERGDNQPRPFCVDHGLSIQRSSLGNVPNFISFPPDRQECVYGDNGSYYRNERCYPNREDFWGHYLVPIARLLSPFIVLLGAILLYKTHDITAPFIGQWLRDSPGIVLIAIGWLLMLDPMRW